MRLLAPWWFSLASCTMHGRACAVPTLAGAAGLQQAYARSPRGVH